MSFSASKCAFEGFRLARRHPGAFLAWAAMFLAFAVAAAVGVYLASGPVIHEIVEGGVASVTPDRIRRLTRGAMVVYPIILALTAIANGAVFRALLRPEERGFAYLRLGADELRLFAIAAILAATDLGLRYLDALLEQALDGAGAAALPLKFAVALAYWCLYVWLAVRITLWAPQAFAERRLDAARAWRLTRGRFWPLLTLYLVLVAVSLVSVFVVVLAGLGVGVIGGALLSLTSHAPSEGGDLNPTAFAVMGAVSVPYLLVVVLLSTLFSAAFAAAYRSLAPTAHEAHALP